MISNTDFRVWKLYKHVLGELIFINPLRNRIYLMFSMIKKIAIVQGPPNTFFLENALKETTEYFLKFRFLFENTIHPFNIGK